VQKVFVTVGECLVSVGECFVSPGEWITGLEMCFVRLVDPIVRLGVLITAL
jgi:hypothetical protein